MHRRSLPIANPCHEDFGSMAQADKQHGTRRFCDSCDKSVHDLSAMTRTQARHFLLENEGERVCIRYRVGHSGALRFRRPPPRTIVPVVVALAGMMSGCAGYVNAEDMEIPEGPTCEDAAGYTIPCMEVEAEPEPEPEPEPEVKVEDEDEDIGYSMGTVVASPIAAAPNDTVEGCPIKIWDKPEADGEMLMGDIESERFSRREARKIEREYRREQRQARR